MSEPGKLSELSPRENIRHSRNGIARSIWWRLAFLLPLLISLQISESIGQVSYTRYLTIERDELRRENGTPHAGIATPDGGYLLAYTTIRSRNNAPNLQLRRPEQPTLADRRSSGLTTIGFMKIGSAGDVLWSRYLDGYRGILPSFMEPDIDQNLVIGGVWLNDPVTLRNHPVLVRVDQHGSFLSLWNPSPAIPGDLIGMSRVDDRFDLLVQDEDSVLVVRVDPERGVVERSTVIRPTIDGTSFIGTGMARDSLGATLVTGFLRSGVNRIYRGGLVLLDSAGTIRSAKIISTAKETTFRSVVGLATGGFVVAGEVVELTDELLATDPEATAVGATYTSHVDVSLRQVALPFVIQLGHDGVPGTSFMISNDRFRLASRSLSILPNNELHLLTTGDDVPPSVDGPQTTTSVGIHFSTNGEAVSSVTIGRLSTGEVGEVQSDEYGRANDTVGIIPVGHPFLNGFAPGTGAEGLYFGQDRRGVPILIRSVYGSSIPCLERLQTRIAMTSFSPIFLDLPVTGRSFRADADRITGSLMTTPVISDDNLASRSLCPEGSVFPSEMYDRVPTDFDLIIQRNVIKPGEIAEAEVHIASSTEQTYTIAIVQTSTGGTIGSITKPLNAPYHETISLPSEKLGPGIYLVTLKAGDRERTVKIQVVP